jgi:hypothetical protein
MHNILDFFGGSPDRFALPCQDAATRPQDRILLLPGYAAVQYGSLCPKAKAKLCA